MSKRLRFDDIVIKETENYIFINKPPFFSTLDDRHEGQSIIDLLRKENEALSLCHRLDKETSGLLLVSKNDVAYKNAAWQFENRDIDKLYHAVAEGRHDLEPILIDAPLYVSNRNVVKVDFAEGKPSETKVRSKEIFKQHTLFECKPVTGRTHQIRVHMSHIAAPLVGDISYGGREIYLSDIKRKFNLKKGTEEQPLFKRVALHAYSMNLKEVNGDPISAEAEYPKDFRVLIEQLQKHL